MKKLYTYNMDITGTVVRHATNHSALDELTASPSCALLASPTLDSLDAVAMTPTLVKPLLRWLDQPGFSGSSAGEVRTRVRRSAREREQALLDLQSEPMKEACRGLGGPASRKCSRCDNRREGMCISSRTPAP